MDAALYEDEIGGDGPAGTGSALFAFDGTRWTVDEAELGEAGASGSFLCSWNDGDGEHNAMRVNWKAELVDL